jgi:ornithine carbamoyltransferase
MMEKKADIRKAKVAFCGIQDGKSTRRPTNATMLMAGKLGFDVDIACPEGFEPDMAIKALDGKGGGPHGRQDPDPYASYEECTKVADFINVYSWVSPEVFAKGLETHFAGDPEFAKQKAKLKDKWCVTKKVVDTAKKDAMVMHCMPVSRNNEVTDEVLNSDKSIIFDEAENRLHTEKAILALLLGGYR